MIHPVGREVKLAFSALALGVAADMTRAAPARKAHSRVERTRASPGVQATSGIRSASLGGCAGGDELNEFRGCRDRDSVAVAAAGERAGLDLEARPSLPLATR